VEGRGNRPEVERRTPAIRSEVGKPSKSGQRSLKTAAKLTKCQAEVGAQSATRRRHPIVGDWRTVGVEDLSQSLAGLALVVDSASHHGAVVRPKSFGLEKIAALRGGRTAGTADPLATGPRDCGQVGTSDRERRSFLWRSPFGDHDWPLPQSFPGFDVFSGPSFEGFGGLGAPSPPSAFDADTLDRRRQPESRSRSGEPRKRFIR
jgi:hypothetical protein